ncbi:hypothetical protein [Sphingomonas sp. 28-63-12]|uniref:hypothetical protein n=1 Tax=Sphingomonas sp. 28-63-12 TaxID=1970434 RepID=UPI0035A86BAD
MRFYQSKFDVIWISLVCTGIAILVAYLNNKTTINQPKLDTLTIVSAGKDNNYSSIYTPLKQNSRILAVASRNGFEIDSHEDKLTGRDPDWAPKTEGDIRNALSQIPYLSKSSPIKIECQYNSCEAVGQIIDDISVDNRKIASQYLINREFADKLAKANVMANEVDLDQKSGTFIVRFSRLRK